MPKTKYRMKNEHGELTRSTDRIYSHVVYTYGYRAYYKNEDGIHTGVATFNKNEPKIILASQWCGRPDLARKAHSEMMKYAGGMAEVEVFTHVLAQPASQAA